MLVFVRQILQIKKVKTDDEIKNDIFIIKFGSTERRFPPEDGLVFVGSKSVFDVKILVINDSPVDSYRHIFVMCVCVCVISH